MVVVPDLRFAVAAVALAGCHRAPADDERLGLGARAERASFDAAALARFGELEKAVATPSAAVGRALGAYRLVESARLSLARGDKHDRLDESWRLEVDGKGNHHLLREDGHGGGVETYAVDGAIVTRPRYARFVRRSAEGDEGERERDAAHHLLASCLSVIGRFAARRDDGPLSVVGRTARKVVLSLAPAPVDAPADAEPGHAWRRDMKVSALDGEVWVDAVTGAPLHAALTASYTAPAGGGGGNDVAVTLELHADVEAVGSVPAIVAPADAAPAPRRPRPLIDRQQLLDGLVTER